MERKGDGKLCRLPGDVGEPPSLEASQLDAPSSCPAVCRGTLDVLCSLSSSVTLWKAWKGFKSNKSPERQRGSNWLLFRMYFCY